MLKPQEKSIHPKAIILDIFLKLWIISHKNHVNLIADVCHLFDTFSKAQILVNHAEIIKGEDIVCLINVKFGKYLIYYN